MTEAFHIPPPPPPRSSPQPDYALWSPRCLLWIGCLTSFLFSGVLQAINYGRLGMEQRRRHWIVSCILFFVPLQTLIFLAPSFYLAAMGGIAINTAAAIYFGLIGLPLFRRHVAAGGSRTAVGILLPCVLASCVLILSAQGGIPFITERTHEARLQHAIHHREEGSFETAQHSLRKYVRRNPKSIKGYWHLAVLHESAGNLERSIEWLERGIENCPRGEEIRFYLDSIRKSLDSERRLLSELPALMSQLGEEDKESRTSALATLKRYSEEGVSTRVALELINYSQNDFPLLSKEPGEDPQVRLIELAAYQHSPASVAAICEAFESWALPAKRAGLNYLATIETRDAATNFVALVQHCAALDPRPELRTGDYDSIPRHLDVLFPELMKFTQIPQFRRPIWLLCNALCSGGWSLEMGMEEMANTLARDFNACMDDLAAYEYPDSTDWMHHEDYIRLRNDMIVLLDVMQHLPFADARKALHSCLESPDPHLQCYAAISLVAHGEKVEPLVIDRIAAHSATRGILYGEFRRRFRLDLFPDRYESQMLLAESRLVQWLSCPNALGRAPDEIQFMYISTVEKEGTSPADYFLFRFKMLEPHTAAKNGWMAGIAGPFQRAGGPTSKGGSHTISLFEAWESKTAEEHVQAGRAFSESRGDKENQ